MSNYLDPFLVQLSDLVNARVKLRHGALSHIITARIIDAFPTSAEIQNLIEHPQQLDALAAQIAAEVMPGNDVINTNGLEAPVTDGHVVKRVPSLPRAGSWSQLLLYQRV